jgi:competence protein ComFC
MASFIQKVNEAFLHFFYPSFCIHCGEQLTVKKYFCQSCLEQLEFLDPLPRCSGCFQEKKLYKQQCEECQKADRSYHSAAAFEYRGPIQTLIHRYKFGGSSFLSKTAAAFMFIQWTRLGWPLPDYVIPVPQSWVKTMERGFNPMALLAQELSLLMGVKAARKLKRCAGDFSQSALDQKLRLSFGGSSLRLRQNPLITGKRVLLIDDVITTGQTIFCCVNALKEEGVGCIDVLSLALTEKG